MKDHYYLHYTNYFNLGMPTVITKIIKTHYYIINAFNPNNNYKFTMS